MKIPTLADISKFITTLCVFFLISTIVRANGVVNDLNYLGTSGLFFVPTGTTLNYGEFNFSYSNMVDVDAYRQRQVSEGDSPFDGNAYSFALSPFPGIELGMSNMGYDLDGGSDLIANVKYSPTFIPDSWFDWLLVLLIWEVRLGIKGRCMAQFQKQLDDG